MGHARNEGPPRDAVLAGGGRRWRGEAARLGWWQWCKAEWMEWRLVELGWWQWWWKAMGVVAVMKGV